MTADTARRWVAAGLAVVLGILGTAGCSGSTSGTGRTAGATSAAAESATPSAVASSAPTAASSGAQPAPTTGAGTGTAVASGSGSSGSGSAPPAPTTIPVPSTPLRTVIAHSSDGDFVIRIWAEVKTGTCYDHAYGQPVIAYLTKHPCTGLDRLLATATVGGRAVGLAISELGFIGTAPASYETAARFVALVKRDGTGNLNDLLRAGYRLPTGPPSIPSPDAFNALAQDDGVAVFDAWYLDTPTPQNDPPLVKMAADVFLQV